MSADLIYGVLPGGPGSDALAPPSGPHRRSSASVKRRRAPAGWARASRERAQGGLPARAAEGAAAGRGAADLGVVRTGPRGAGLAGGAGRESGREAAPLRAAHRWPAEDTRASLEGVGGGGGRLAWWL